jgi:hypothetical protein
MRDRSSFWPRWPRVSPAARVYLALGLGAVVACAALVGLDKDYTDCGASPCVDAAASTPPADVSVPPPDASDGGRDASDAAPDTSEAGPVCPGFADAASTGVDDSMIQFAIPEPSKLPVGAARYDAGGADGGTAYDAVTGLTWERFPEATPETGHFTFDEARTYCTNLRLDGRSDWRLPTRGELISLTDYRFVQPALDPTTFPRVLDPVLGGPVPRGIFWSSTPVSGTPTHAWYVGADDGYFNISERDCSKATLVCPHVRCVR